MNVRFECPECGAAIRLDPTGKTACQCHACGHEAKLESPGENGALCRCLVCGNSELYRRKDFPHRLGMAILALACLASIVPYQRYMVWLVWAIMLGSLAFDVLLYRLVRDVVVCYRCNAHYRGLISPALFPPHDLGIAERYRQERYRLEELRAAKRPPVA